MKKRFFCRNILIVFEGLLLLAQFVFAGLDMITNLGIYRWALYITFVIWILWFLGKLYIKNSQIFIPKINAITLDNEADRREYGRKGLIVVVSRFRSFSKDINAKGSAFIEGAIEARNYEALDVMNSNFKPAIIAALAHQDTLQHCWLLATTANSEGRSGSTLEREFLLGYLRDETELASCKFYCGTDYEISVNNDAQVTHKTKDLINKIFKEAKKLGLKENDIVADLTGGLKSISLGIALACITATRDVQYEATDYLPNGNPSGNMTPVLYDIQIQLKDPDL